MHIGERQELIPVECSDFVFAGAVVKADRMQYRLIEWRHLLRAEVTAAEKPIDRASPDACEELAFWIGPAVFFRARNVNRARRDQGYQLVSIDRKLIDMVSVLAVVRAEPIWEPVNQVPDSLTVVAPRQRCAAFARAAREHHRNALIHRACP